MTYEEAISELVVIKSVYSHMRGEYKPCVEALQMAIDLLRQADTPQTEEICERCIYVRGSQWCQGCNGTPKRWNGEKVVDTPQTETISLQGGEDVHDFCKGCGESRVRHFYGERYIVCKQADDAPSICLKKCPLSKGIADEVDLISPQTERSKNAN